MLFILLLAQHTLFAPTHSHPFSSSFLLWLLLSSSPRLLAAPSSSDSTIMRSSCSCSCSARALLAPTHSQPFSSFLLRLLFSPSSALLEVPSSSESTITTSSCSGAAKEVFGMQMDTAKSTLKPVFTHKKLEHSLSTFFAMQLQCP